MAVKSDKKKDKKTGRIFITLPLPMINLLNDLTETGILGTRDTEVAQALIKEGIKVVLGAEWIKEAEKRLKKD